MYMYHLILCGSLKLKEQAYQTKKIYSNFQHEGSFGSRNFKLQKKYLFVMETEKTSLRRLLGSNEMGSPQSLSNSNTN